MLYIVIEESASSVAVSNAKLEAEFDTRGCVILGSGVPGGVLRPEKGVRSEAVDITLCGSRREKSSDNAVVGKR